MKKVSLLLVLVFAAITISAQESGFSTKAGRKATFARNGFWDNWFIGLGAGANFVQGDNNKDADFLNRLTVAPTIQVGKWYNPYIGGRLKFQGGSLHNFQNNATDMIHNKYFGVEADVMWDVTNYLGKYNEKRVYSLIPYVGIGGAIGWDYKLDGNTHPGGKQRNFTINGGIINKFKFSNRVALDIDLSAMLLKEAFNHGGSNSYDGLVAASASLVFKVGKKTDFSEALLMDQGLIDDLNGQINKLRQENDRLRNQPAKEVIKEVVKDCPKCPEATKGSFVSNVVFFRLGSANIDKNQEVSIFNTAKYLQDNPSAKVKVVGYADKKTGTPSINEKLSEKRAKNVANELIKKYNIDSNRVTVEWKGDTVQPYAENAWNRVAIFVAQ
ncbi:MAG: OmpA family protein [Prevotella sp.]|jgi:outer membrane protein OmpA-like peptidoglycan-associated protein|uniref:OmpA family protein n=1 Tax=unclassified Dysgonomonas TaxID=2630389 RepID=UPI0025BD40FB|nr:MULTISPECIES: OmpA family protein [unclassified Dysgonomonas]MDR1716215.1 OmpA family protein [Prevotella sp.]MDR2005552.1 OmpA family protein [Prevotella sp.]HMM01491.1 OmpA family protein [Dysgonomonas sp.]